MTSMTSRDDIEFMLHRAGVRPWGEVVKLMNAIDQYAIHRARVFAEPAMLMEAYAHLGPGEWDLNEKATRCAQCNKVKKWSGNFTADRENPSRHATVCRVCTGDAVPFVPIRKSNSVKDKPGHNKDGTVKKWICSECKDPKLPEEYGPRKNGNPRAPLPCLECEGKTVSVDTER